MSEIAQRTENDVHAIAKAMNLVAFLPEPRELFLDLDGQAQPNKKVMSQLEFPEDNEGESAFIVTKSVSSFLTTSKGGNRHMYIKLNRDIHNPLARIALQAALGSDPVKEYLAVHRVMIGSDAAVALFETPEWAPKVVAWRRRTKGL